MGFPFVLVVIALLHLFGEWADEAAEREAAAETTLVAWPAFVIFGLLACLKFRLAKDLESSTLRQDAVASLFGAILSLMSGMSSMLELALVGAGDSYDAFGVVDPVVTLVMCTMMMAEGVRVVREHSPYAR